VAVSETILANSTRIPGTLRPPSLKTLPRMKAIEPSSIAKYKSFSDRVPDLTSNFSIAATAKPGLRNFRM
jgi:hypothetical protein